MKNSCENALVTDDKTLKGDVLIKFIKIAQACFKINNLNTCFALVLGLEHSSISKLKLAWKRVPKKLRTILDELLELFNPSFNFKKYRETLAEVIICFSLLITVHRGIFAPPSFLLISHNS